MINAFILTEPGKPNQFFVFDGTSEFAAIRAFRRARQAANHRLAQIVVERELEDFDVPALKPIGFNLGPCRMPFGQALKTFRGRMNRSEFARSLCVSESRLSQWERGTLVPSEERLQELCEVLPGLGELMRGERRAG